MSETVKVQIRRLAHNPEGELPAYQSALAAGMDLCACLEEAVVIEPGAIEFIPTGFAMALPAGFEAQVRPRSGLACKFGVTLPNSPGTIDADYRGEVKVALINLGKQPFTVEPGMRVAQMVVAAVVQVGLVEVEELDETVRGSGGFGHTGV